MLNAHIDEAALAPAGIEAAVGSDGPRDPSEETLMVLDGRYQQRCISSGFVDRDIGDDPALRFLHLHDHAELRWPIQLSLADDLRPRLEDADDLARRARLGAEHAGASLPHHLAAMLGSSRDRGSELLDAAPPPTSHCMQLSLPLLRRPLGLAYQATGDPQQPPVWLADGAFRSLASPTQPLGDFSHPVGDASTHVAHLEAQLHSCLHQSLHRAAEHADHVLA